MLSRIPKRGFNNANFRKEYQVVNVATLEEKFEDGERVDTESLAAAKLINDLDMPIKVLGDGKIDKKLTVAASKFSATAKEKITKAGGTVEEV
jgi:large subunit ribosomal protein L15